MYVCMYICICACLHCQYSRQYYTYTHTVAGDVMAGEEDVAEDGGGRDVGDQFELPTDLVSHTYSISLLCTLSHITCSVTSLI